MEAAYRHAPERATTSTPSSVNAFYLRTGDLGEGRLLIQHPVTTGPVRNRAVFIHALGEEMNKSRRMAAQQARALAAAGCEVVQIDLAGCGDSSGDFGEVTWRDWVDDVVMAVNWLVKQAPRQQDSHDQPPKLWLWGHRVGCLLAAEALRRIEVPASVLFWQPVTSGKMALQQFLRLRVAGEMLGNATRGLMESLKRDLAAGRCVDVAGYRLSPGLGLGLQAATLDPPDSNVSQAGAASPRRAVWLELSTQQNAMTTPAVAASAERWSAAGWLTQASVVHGPSFWQTTEIEDAPDLIDATLDAIQRHEVAT